MTPSRKPRRSFTAPLIVTMAALPIGACVVASNKPASDPDTGDHRGSQEPEQRDHREGTDGPRQYDQDQSWTVHLQDDGSCLAYADASCPPDTECNPPRPSVVTCPDGIASDGPMQMWVNAGETQCFVTYAGSMDCPEGASCNPPPPQKAECPQ